MLPDFIGIGAPKAGTTWLARQLAAHPRVFVPERKEVNTFDYADFDEHALREYERHFDCADAILARGEISTRYLHSSVAPERIKSVLPHVKLLVSLRNPVDQVYSHYWHLRRQDFHGAGPKEWAIEFETTIERRPELLEPAFYHKHLSRWLDHFPREQLFVAWFDDLVSVPCDVLRDLFLFLAVDTPEDAIRAPTGPGVADRLGVSPRSESLERVHRAAYRGLVRHVYNPLKRRIGPRRAAMVKDRLQARRIMERLFFRRGYPAMDDALRRRLACVFRDDVARLGRALDRDLSAWMPESG